MLFGIGRERVEAPPHHLHQPEFESFSYKTTAICDRTSFEEFADSLGTEVYRAKGFVKFSDATYLFNFVAGRWELELFEQEGTQLVFIGKLSGLKDQIINNLKLCEQ